jgi:hypothetical protein
MTKPSIKNVAKKLSRVGITEARRVHVPGRWVQVTYSTGEVRSYDLATWRL